MSTIAVVSYPTTKICQKAIMIQLQQRFLSLELPKSSNNWMSKPKNEVFVYFFAFPIFPTVFPFQMDIDPIQVVFSSIIKSNSTPFA